MKLVYSTSPWLVPGVLELLQQHGLHPVADPANALQDERVLPNQTSVPIAVPDHEAAQARALLARDARGAKSPLRPSTLALVLLAAAFLAVVLQSPAGRFGSTWISLLAASGAALVVVIAYLRTHVGSHRGAH